MKEIRDSGREIIMVIRINNNVKKNKREKERKDERAKKMNK